jgi:hypothetical protein
MLDQVLLTTNVLNIGVIKNRWWARSLKSALMRRLGVKIAKRCGHYDFLVFSDSEASKQVKKFNMDKSAVKDLMFGGINELMRNRNYYYHSGVGQAYSYWTDEGKLALVEYMNVMGWKLKEAEEEDLKERSKQLVLKGLKGEEI